MHIPAVVCPGDDIVDEMPVSTGSVEVHSCSLATVWEVEHHFRDCQLTRCAQSEKRTVAVAIVYSTVPSSTCTKPAICAECGGQ